MENGSKHSTSIKEGLLSTFDESYIRGISNMIHLFAENFYNLNHLDGKVYFDDHIMEYCLEDILVDIARLKYFHDIKYVNEIKLMAYIASWILKRKPFQLIEGCDSKFIYINEKFALSILVQTVGLNNPDMFYRDENRESIVRNMDAIFYHLKYRNTNPQTLELLLMGIQTGMMMEK